MEQKLSCALVKDLLPNYVEKMTSEETNKSIREHLESCEACQCTYEQMHQEISISEKTAPQISNFKKYLNKTKFTFVMNGLFFTGLLGIGVSLLVDFIINGCLSWSLIVTAGVLYADCIVYTLVKSNKHKFAKALLCVSVLIVPFLAVVQFAMYYYLKPGSEPWLLNMAVPIALYWVVVLWVLVFVKKIFKLNWFYIIALSMTLSITGNIMILLLEGTCQTIAECTQPEIFLKFLGNIVGAVVFWFVGVFYNNYKKKKGKGTNTNLR